jgi:uncharacterized Zn-finger protein
MTSSSTYQVQAVNTQSRMAISTLIHSDLQEISSTPRSNSSSLLRQNTTPAIHFDEGSSNNLLPIASVTSPIKKKSKKVSCTLCINVFANLASCKRHIATVHEKKKDYVCEELIEENQICGKKFSQTGSLNRHKAIHNLSKPLIICTHFLDDGTTRCDRIFKRQDGLKMHINRIHFKMLPFMCAICNKQFGEKRSLVKHNQKPCNIS